MDGMSLDSFLSLANKKMIDSERVFVWDDTIVYEDHRQEERRLLLLAARQKAEPSATSILPNLFCVGVRRDEKVSQSIVPGRLVNALLADEHLWHRLPAIQHYARRPVFDCKFNLLGPGYHAQKKSLVHGPNIEPRLPVIAIGSDTSHLDRLPPTLRQLLLGFCWTSDADLSNAVALLITGVLANHFIFDPKPLAVVDGNQRGVGKTLLVQCIGHILDAEEPPRIPLVGDEELEKRLCAHVREPRSSLLFFDNVRNRIESSVLEQNALAPVVTFRLLGQNATITRTNTFLWIITANQTSATEDLISRALPIRLRYEGNPRDRDFSGSPLDFARQNRAALMGELMGMVLRWKEAGKKPGRQKHRCARWARDVGGILMTAGLHQFLANVEEAEATMDEGMQGLATLAELVVARNLRDCYAASGEVAGKEKGRLPKDWTQLFLDADVYRDKLVEKSRRGRDTLVGMFLSGKTNRSVTINVGAGAAAATLRKIEVRSDQSHYFFELADWTGNIRGTVPAQQPGATNIEATSGEVGSNDVITPAPNGDITPVPSGSASLDSAAPPTSEGNELEWL